MISGGAIEQLEGIQRIGTCGDGRWIQRWDIARAAWQVSTREAFHDPCSFGQAGAFFGHPEARNPVAGIHFSGPRIALDSNIPKEENRTADGRR